jgi:VWFA-related protein
MKCTGIFRVTEVIFNCMNKGPSLWLILFALIGAMRSGAQDIRAHGEITVARVVVDARVIDSKGNPVEGLRPLDFRARIDSVPAEIESVEWIDSTAAYAEGLTPEEAQESGSAMPPQGRLIVIFFQTDFQRARAIGQMRMITHAIEFLDTLNPYDRVAVLSFDSHLKLRQDFTNDREKLAKAIRNSILTDEPPPPEVVASPALASRLDLKEAKKAVSSEKGLFLIGNALLPIPGPKTLILFGWGLGVYGATGVSMIRDYALARNALDASRTSVFSLDISDADFHSLEVGLSKVAADTGGFYEKTHLFPRFAMEKLERVIAGHYEVVLKRPESLGLGRHTINLTLQGKKGTVLARTTFQDVGE